MILSNNPHARTIGTIVCRVIVPLWIAAGFIFKLRDFTPATLPQWIRDASSSVAGNLDAASGSDVLTYGLISLLVVEALAFLFMVLSPRLARPTAIFMLVSFCIVLIVELALHGNQQCGCFGEGGPKPGTMLAIDAAFLTLVVLFKPADRTTPLLPAAMIALFLATLAAGILTKPQRLFPDDDDDGTLIEQRDLHGGGGPLAALPDWYWPEPEKWIGKRWDELDIAAYMRRWPTDWDQGTRLIFFHRKDCDACHQLLDTYFVGEAPYPTTLIAVPERGGFPDATHEHNCTNCEELRLRVGPDWIFSTPVILRLENGVVTCGCTEDPDDPKCLY